MISWHMESIKKKYAILEANFNSLKEKVYEV
jgi:hypothetical protein